MDGLVRAITFDIFYLLNSAHICYMISFPIVLTLWYSGIHISTMNYSNKTSNIKFSTDKTSCFRATLSISDIDPDNGYIQLGRYFDYSWFGGQNDVIEYMIVF